MDQSYTFEILQELKSFSGRDFFLQIVWPFFTTLLGFFGAYLLLYRQFIQQKKVEREKEKEEQQMIFKILCKTNLNLKRALISNLEHLRKSKTNLYVNKFDMSFVFELNGNFFSSITSIGYQKLYALFEKARLVDVDYFISYWGVVSNMTNHLQNIEKYFLAVDSRVVKLTNSLERYVTDITIQAGEILYAYYPPFDKSGTDNQKNNLDPKFRLANKIQQIFNEFDHSQESQLVKITHFLDSFKQLHEDPELTTGLNVRIVQLVLNASAVITTMEELFASAQLAYEDFEQILEHALVVIEDFDNKDFSVFDKE
ncbi:hypothetical protein [Sphingobacterium sp. MYb382]|uniref:hypothetical protein n=1 Tax=Sphingobacterium sp. MYb382 TaxID=2745278 RepID=UPI0030ABA30A